MVILLHNKKKTVYKVARVRLVNGFQFSPKFRREPQKISHCRRCDKSFIRTKLPRSWWVCVCVCTLHTHTRTHMCVMCSTSGWRRRRQFHGNQSLTSDKRSDRAKHHVRITYMIALSLYECLYIISCAIVLCEKFGSAPQTKWEGRKASTEGGDPLKRFVPRDHYWIAATITTTTTTRFIYTKPHTSNTRYSYICWVSGFSFMIFIAPRRSISRSYSYCTMRTQVLSVCVRINPRVST